jgi:hypothetical protein
MMLASNQSNSGIGNVADICRGTYKLSSAFSSFSMERSESVPGSIEHTNSSLIKQYFSHLTVQNTLPSFVEVKDRIKLLLDSYPALQASVRTLHTHRVNCKTQSAVGCADESFTTQSTMKQPKMVRQNSAPGKTQQTFTKDVALLNAEKLQAQGPMPMQRSHSAPVRGVAGVRIQHHLHAGDFNRQRFLLDHAFWREKLKQALSDLAPLVLGFTFGPLDFTKQYTAAFVLQKSMIQRTMRARRCIGGYDNLALVIEQATAKYDAFFDDSQCTVSR